ncbi:MAG TPA: ParB/RepB/Spo0J family partition protein [Blastocatellia bacterium]|nr:ParB/RepB/Spo0J family partition protein [Blastocatellia bacterium]
MSRKALGRGLDALFTPGSAPDRDLVDVDIDRIRPAGSQPRGVFRDSPLEGLASSIRQNGIIQPLVVRRHGDGFQIIAGERRWRAAQMAGLHRVPCIVKDVPDESLLELSLIENIQREELSPIEEANAYRRLLEARSLTQEEVAQRVGKDRSSITNSLRLLKLPAEIQRSVENQELSAGHARALLSIDSHEAQIKLARQIAERELSVREAERLVKRAQSPSTETRRSRTVRNHTDQPNIAAAEVKLSKRLEAPVRIRFNRSGGGALEIRFSSTDDLARLFDGLMKVYSVVPPG